MWAGNWFREKDHCMLDDIEMGPDGGLRNHRDTTGA